MAAEGESTRLNMPPAPIDSPPAIKRYCGCACLSRTLTVIALICIFPFLLAALPFVLIGLLVWKCCSCCKEQPPTDQFPWLHQLQPSPSTSTGSPRTTQFITMSDGTKLAADIYLVESTDRVDIDGLGLQQHPTLFHQTRYHRSVDLVWPLSSLVGSFPLMKPLWKLAGEAGFAVVSIDVRGTGASFGRHAHALSPQELRDSLAVCDWIIKQPWSDGRIVTSGISYDGMAAYRTLAHPAVVAAAPLYMFWDLYDSVMTSGGSASWWFVHFWSLFNSNADRNRICEHESFGVVRHLVDTVTPVEADEEVLRAAVADHVSNWDARADIDLCPHRDDPAPSAGDDVTIGQISPYSSQMAHKPLLLVSGWFCTGCSGSISALSQV